MAVLAGGLVWRSGGLGSQITIETEALKAFMGILPGKSILGLGKPSGGSTALGSQIDDENEALEAFMGFLPGKLIFGHGKPSGGPMAL